MNETRLKRLFAAARKEPSPLPSPEFVGDVLRAVKQAPAGRAHITPSLFEQLNHLFPRVALAAIVIMVLCVAADFALSSAGYPGLTDGASQISSQYLFDPEGV